VEEDENGDFSLNEEVVLEEPTTARLFGKTTKQDGGSQNSVDQAVLPLAGMEKLYLRLVLDKGARTAGVEYDQAKADISARLALIKIPVVFVVEDPGLDSGRYPLLAMDVSAGLDKKWFKPDTFLVSAGFKDVVLLQRDNTVRAAATLWTVMEHGYDNRLVPAIRESLMRLADSFVLAWAKANPDRLNPQTVMDLDPPKASEADPLKK
jgi:hypothetical protein